MWTLNYTVSVLVSVLHSVYCVYSRLYVLHRLPNLKFLDSTEVSEEEQKEAKRVGQFMKVVKPSDSQVKIG